MAVSGTRLTVVQQVTRSAGFRGRPLAVTGRGLQGKSLRAADVIPLPSLSVARAYGLEIQTPSGLVLDNRDLVGKTAEQVDALATQVDAIGNLSASRAPEIPIPETVRFDSTPYIFTMGADDLGYSKPTRGITITRPFGIGKYEVTVAEFRAFVDATNYEITGQGAEQLTVRLADTSKDRHPVTFVHYDDTVAYTQWLSEKTGRRFRLPTEAEGEFVAAGTEGRKFPWGDEFDPSRLHSRSSGTTPVDQYQSGATPDSVFDLAGNVWEWRKDFWADSYDPSKTQDPTGPEQGTTRVLRGGSFYGEDADNFRSANRYDFDPSSRHDDYGFRVAEDLG